MRLPLIRYANGGGAISVTVLCSSTSLYVPMPYLWATSMAWMITLSFPGGFTVCSWPHPQVIVSSRGAASKEVSHAIPLVVHNLTSLSR